MHPGCKIYLPDSSDFPCCFGFQLIRIRDLHVLDNAAFIILELVLGHIQQKPGEGGRVGRGRAKGIPIFWESIQPGRHCGYFAQTFWYPVSVWIGGGLNPVVPFESKGKVHAKPNQGVS